MSYLKLLAMLAMLVIIQVTATVVNIVGLLVPIQSHKIMQPLEKYAIEMAR